MVNDTFGHGVGQATSQEHHGPDTLSPPAVIQHDFSFDPSYGYDLNGLRAIAPPPPPEGYADFWQERYQRALLVDPQPRLSPSRHQHPEFCVFDLQYRSTDGFDIFGWLLWPTRANARRGIVMGHGYGGIEAPGFDLPCHDAVYLVPCFRGLACSRRPPISDDPNYHVLHDIHRRDRYILCGCVEDLWIGVSALLQLAPHLAGHLGYMGISFGGGIGALAIPWDTRIVRAHFNVPTFGNHPLRLTLPTVGSAAAVQSFASEHPRVLEVLAYYDAAVAAQFISQPVHLAAALFDPAVAPPGQFSIYNAIRAPKQLFVLTAGHFDYLDGLRQEQQLLEELSGFFATL